MLVPDGLHDSSVHSPPEFHDVRIGLPPCIHQLRELLLRQPHLQSTHCLERTYGAAIAKGQFRNLTLLAQVAVDAVFLHGHLEHLRCAGAIDVSTLGEHLLPPYLPGKPRDDTGLNRTEVGYQKVSTISGNECGADKLGERVRHILIQQLHSIKVAGAHQSTGLRQVRKVVLGQVLQLNVSAREAPGSVCPIEHEHPTGATVAADGFLHCLVFPDGGLGQLLPEREHLRQLWWCRFQELRHDPLTETVGLHAIVGEPLLHLLDGVGVLQCRHALHGISQLLPGTGIHLDGLLHELHIDADATVVDFLVDVVFLPDLWRYRELGELPLDAHLGLYITGIVAFEQLPFVRRMEGPVSGALAIRLGGKTGLAEVFDELLALGELLLLQTENDTDTLQGKRQAHCSRPDHRAMPALRVEIFTGGITEIPGEAYPLEGSIEGPLDDGIVLQRGQHLLGDMLPTGKVDHLHRPGVDAVAEEQDFKIGRLTVTINSGLLERDVAVGLNIDTECFHRHILSEQWNMGGGIAPTTRWMRITICRAPSYEPRDIPPRAGHAPFQAAGVRPPTLHCVCHACGRRWCR